MLVFFNDILIYNCTMEDHLAHLESVFVEMKKHQLLAKKTCFFGVHRIKFLGHFITSEGISTDPHKVEAVRNWPTPSTLKRMRGF